jgi:hypothetical protein
MEAHMKTRTVEYPFDTRHPDATAGILPLETRETLLQDGWIHESEVDAISNTRHTGRRRWNIPHAMIGNERYYRVEDITVRLEESYNAHRKTLDEKEADEKKVRTAVA